MNTATAKLKYLRIAPRKVRRIADTIRGLSVNEAEGQLMLRPQRPAPALLKLLRSAIANAKNKKLEVGKLEISKITVDQGPILKRFIPRAMGRATPIEKKTSHITIVLAESGKQLPTRFKFLSKPKKEKKVAKPKGRKTEPKPELKEKPRVEEKPGFFRRIFRRKAV